MSRSTGEQPVINGVEDEPVVLEFEIVPESLELATTSKSSIEEVFMPYFQKAVAMQKETASITNPRLAKEAKLEAKRLRCAAEKERVELKAEYLKMGKGIDAANKLLLSIIEPIEKNMEDVEMAEIRKIQAEREAWNKVRQDLIRPFHNPALPMPDLTDLTDTQFEAVLEEAKASHARREELARQAAAEQARKEAEAAAAAELARKETERLRQEALAARQKLAEERAEAARVLAAAQAKAAQEAAEREKQALKERQAAAEALRLERLARQAAEAKAATPVTTGTTGTTGTPQPVGASDYEKLMALAKAFKAVAIPVMTSLEGGAIVKQIAESQDKFVKWIEKKAAELPPSWEAQKPAVGDDL